jgi:tricarballylate dehydrogenase
MLQAVDKRTVIVVGSGIAGLCAAISAAEDGAKVVLIEKAPPESRGGNGRFTSGNFRYARFSDPFGRKPYPPEKFYNDILRISGGRANPMMAQMIVNGSQDIHRWMTDLGVEWILHDDATKFPNIEFPTALGEGAGMVDYLINAANKKGVQIMYDTALQGLVTDSNGGVVGVNVNDKSTGLREIKCGAVVLACGGFEASPEMRAKYLGPEEATMIVRGTRYNTGEGLKIAMDIGAQAVGDWGGYHGCGVCSTSPLADGGNLKLDDFSRGIVVNKLGKRFFDEATDFRMFVNATLGKLIIRQPEGKAFFIFDAETRKHISQRQPIPDPIEAPTLYELAIKVGIDPNGLVETAEKFNAAVQPGEFDPYKLDGKHTRGVDPPKSNWALPIEKPPFIAYEMRGGITFTFGGIKVNERTEVLNDLDSPIPGLYAAGEIIGDFWYYSYVGGAALTKVAVEGRIAGKIAARYVVNKQAIHK